MSVGAGNCSQGSGAAWPSVTPDRDPRQELWREGLALLGPFRDTLGMRPLKEKAPRRQEAAGPHPQTRTACLAPRADEKLEHKAQAMLQHKDLPPGRVTPEAGGADLLNRKNLRGQGNTQRCEETTGRTGPEVQAPSPGKWFTSRTQGEENQGPADGLPVSPGKGPRATPRAVPQGSRETGTSGRTHATPRLSAARPDGRQQGPTQALLSAVSHQARYAHDPELTTAQGQGTA